MLSRFPSTIAIIVEEVLGSTAVDNAPPYSSYLSPILCEKGFGYFFVSQDVLYAESMQNGKQERTKAGYHHGDGILPFIYDMVLGAIAAHKEP